MFVRRNNNYGVCCSVVMPVSVKNIDRELRRPEGDEIGVGLFVEPLQDGIDHSEEPGLYRLCSEYDEPLHEGVLHLVSKPDHEKTRFIFTINFLDYMKFLMIIHRKDTS